MGKYDLSGSSYVQQMDERTTQFNGLICRAERLRQESGGLPTKEEASLYYQAAKICDEIMNMNAAQRAIVAKWKMLRMDCEEKVKQITEILAPEKKPQEAKELKNTNILPFKSSNASKEIPAETIAGWYQERPKHDFQDVIGMDALKTKLLEEAANIGWDRIDEALKINPVQSYFFYGPPGTGKTFLIEAFASEMMKKDFKFIRLLGGDIHASLVGVAEKTVQTAFKEAIDNEPCIIFMDEIEGVCVERNAHNAEGHEKRLTNAFLEAYNLLRESHKRVIFMGATNHPGRVDEAMLDRVKMIKVPLPDDGAKENYFRRSFGMISLEKGFDFQEMVENTDNYSYRDLSRLCDSILVRIKQILINDYAVRTEDGEIEQEATDIAGKNALLKGKVKLTREMFEDFRKENPPSDKTNVRRELQEFEERIGALE